MFKLEFSTSNAAFSEGADYESARLLREIAEDVESGRLKGKILDYNGSSIGTWELDS